MFKFFTIPHALADVAPDDYYYPPETASPVPTSQVIPTISDSPSVTNTPTSIEKIFLYFAATLLFELPVYYLFGIKSKKAFSWIIFVNAITVPALHVFNSLSKGLVTHGLWLIVAEIIITLFEAFLLMVFLEEEPNKTKIFLATVVANTTSAIIGTYLMHAVLGNFF